MVVGARGIGKTYGLRKFCIKNDYLKRGYRYVEIVRYKNQIAPFMKNYFSRLSTDEDLKQYEFKTEGDTGYIRKKRIILVLSIDRLTAYQDKNF